MIPANSDEAAHLLSKHILPLGLKSSSNLRPWDGANRATLTLLRLRERDVFVTCFHVLETLRQMQENEPSAEMVAYLSSTSRLIELKGYSLIDCDERSLDVAIFKAADDDDYLPGMKFIDYESSFLADPVLGEGVYIVGYPAANVEVKPAVSIFGYVYIRFGVSSVSEQRVIMANENGSWSFLDYDNPPRAPIFFGGISGSPAFVIRDHKARFIGIVTDCSARDQTIMISKLGCLKPDGTLDHTLIPP
jgi:hypothetical protein